MQAQTHSTAQVIQAPQQFKAQYLPLEQVSKPNLKTDEAAFYLDRAEQTLRIWACRSGTGPMTPRRINGRLAWNTAEVKVLCGVTV